VKLTKLLLKPYKCFVRLLENILQAGQHFLNDFHASRLVECHFEGDERPGRPNTNKSHKIFKEFENSSMKTIAKHSMKSQTFRSIMEFARRY
jgi:hypothetical protein